MSANNDKSLDSNIAFYQDNANEYFESSSNIDMTHLYPSLLKLLTKGAKILDAGCGSGRDIKYFIKHGYKVSAFDASLPLSKLASEYSGVQVEHQTFETIQYLDEFDAVWACASLLHLNRLDLAVALRNLSKACKDNAIIYASFKTTSAELNDGRKFYLYSKDDINAFLNLEPSLSVLKHWYTKDSLSRANTKWLNLLLQVKRK